MFDVPADLAEEHGAALASLPSPLPPACVRLLRAASARDRRQAEGQRKSSRTQRCRAHAGRAARLSRGAAVADDRALELAMEAR